MGSFLLCTGVLLLFNIQAFNFVSGESCRKIYNCKSCVSQSGFLSCLWCPRDNACHTSGSLLNPCSKSENVRKVNDCDRVVANYDPTLAYKMVYLSALAYSDNVAKYIPRTKLVNSFRLVKQVTEDCPDEAFCSGYVAVSHDEGAITVAFRGSEHKKQVIAQALSILGKPKVTFVAGGKVQEYFKHAFQLVWNGLKTDFRKQIAKYPSYKIWLTGHSLGGALASLASTTIAYHEQVQKNNLCLYTFGQPRVGDYDYALAHDKFVPTSFRVTHFRDPVVHLPTCISAAFLCTTAGPYHHGKEIFYDNRVMTNKSSYQECHGLPYNEDIACCNNPKIWSHCFKSPGALADCIKDHKMYFDINVGDWWKDAPIAIPIMNNAMVNKAWWSAGCLIISVYKTLYISHLLYD